MVRELCDRIGFGSTSYTRFSPPKHLQLSGQHATSTEVFQMGKCQLYLRSDVEVYCTCGL